MSDIDWSQAPEGYDYFIVHPGGLGFFKIYGEHYINKAHMAIDMGSGSIQVTKRNKVTDSVHPLVRQTNEIKRRSTMPKQERYKDGNGDDWIDEFARTATPEEFRGAMKFTIGKYIRRCGKKDDIKKEVYKIADYGQRWLFYEKGLDK